MGAANSAAYQPQSTGARKISAKRITEISSRTVENHRERHPARYNLAQMWHALSPHQRARCAWHLSSIARCYALFLSLSARLPCGFSPPFWRPSTVETTADAITSAARRGRLEVPESKRPVQIAKPLAASMSWTVDSKRPLQIRTFPNSSQSALSRYPASRT